MLGLATKKDLQETDRLVEMIDRHTSRRLVRGQDDIAELRAALYAELDAIKEKQARFHATLDAVGKFQAMIGAAASTSRRQATVDVDSIAAKLDALLAHLGLEAVQRPAQEAGWEVRECQE